MIDKKNAIIYTHNLLAENFAKTAHGLLRGTERYNIVAVIDKIISAKMLEMFFIINLTYQFMKLLKVFK